MSDSFEQNIRGVMSGEDRSIKAAIARVSLSILSVFYRIAVAIRYAMFDWNIRSPKRLSAPVISVGNLTTGGTGKTPVVAWIVESLYASGHSPAILMRGYAKERGQPSDEYLMYIGRYAPLPEVHVIASPKRYDAGLQALARPSPPDVFVLDDGFQHRQLDRDLDIVLIDATNPFGYGRLLPRGMLRETLAGIARADAVLITRADQIAPDDLEDLNSKIKQMVCDKPVIECTSALTNVIKLDDEMQPIWTLRSRKVFAFCGVGNPKSFQRLLERIDANVVGLHALEDHQVYTPQLMKTIIKKAKDAGAEMLLTTEKDWLKVVPFAIGAELPICCARMQVAFSPSDAEKLLQLINTKIMRK